MILNMIIGVIIGAIIGFFGARYMFKRKLCHLLWHNINKGLPLIFTL